VEIETNPMNIFLKAVDNCKPILKVISVKKSGISYQCPTPMSEKEREFKAYKLILESSLEKDRTMRFYDKLANELIEAYKNQVDI
jgi:small subunit ribosomal protein S7